MKFCVLQLYAPLVSWGEIAVGGERRSAVQPSKSAIVGLVAAAKGIKRTEEELLASLAGSLGVAVRVSSPGSVMSDFHTVQTPKLDRKFSFRTRKDELSAPQDKIGTILSHREYRCDTYALVALWARDDSISLDDLAENLRKPAFHLYCGRKALPPALPLCPQIVEAETLKSAFEQAFFPYALPVTEKASDRQQTIHTQALQLLSETEQYSFYWEEGVDAGVEPLQRATRYDAPLSRARWQFRPREEYMAVSRREETSHVHEST